MGTPFLAGFARSGDFDFAKVENTRSTLPCEFLTLRDSTQESDSLLRPSELVFLSYGRSNPICLFRQVRTDAPSRQHHLDSADYAPDAIRPKLRHGEAFYARSWT